MECLRERSATDVEEQDQASVPKKTRLFFVQRPLSVLYYKTERNIQCAMSFSRCTWVILVPNLVAIVLICGTLLYYWAEPPVKHVATLRRNRERTFDGEIGVLILVVSTESGFSYMVFHSPSMQMREDDL
uniref:Uncharacterized protein n=1 Tax=Timema genevievae TaxID=629358 RepID=A0A7R9JNJ4_TIMGE|nr:unnamed protein product [Timema genevievae]